MCKNLDSPHPLAPSPKFGRRGNRTTSPLSHDGRGDGGEGRKASVQNWNAPVSFFLTPHSFLHKQHRLHLQQFPLMLQMYLLKHNSNQLAPLDYQFL
jgi:hypothetical protein